MEEQDLHLKEQAQIERLARKIGRYQLTVVISKRARDLKERGFSLSPRASALIDKALVEVAQGKLRIVSSE